MTSHNIEFMSAFVDDGSDKAITDAPSPEKHADKKSATLDTSSNNTNTNPSDAPLLSPYQSLVDTLLRDTSSLEAPLLWCHEQELLPQHLCKLNQVNTMSVPLKDFADIFAVRALHVCVRSGTYHKRRVWNPRRCVEEIALYVGKTLDTSVCVLRHHHSLLSAVQAHVTSTPDVTMPKLRTDEVAYTLGVPPLLYTQPFTYWIWRGLNDPNTPLSLIVQVTFKAPHVRGLSKQYLKKRHLHKDDISSKHIHKCPTSMYVRMVGDVAYTKTHYLKQLDMLTLPIKPKSVTWTRWQCVMNKSEQDITSVHKLLSTWTLKLIKTPLLHATKSIVVCISTLTPLHYALRTCFKRIQLVVGHNDSQQSHVLITWRCSALPWTRTDDGMTVELPFSVGTQHHMNLTHDNKTQLNLNAPNIDNVALRFIKPSSTLTINFKHMRVWIQGQCTLTWCQSEFNITP